MKYYMFIFSLDFYGYLSLVATFAKKSSSENTIQVNNLDVSSTNKDEQEIQTRYRLINKPVSAKLPGFRNNKLIGVTI